MTIYFYGHTREWGELSNFSPHGFSLDGAYWPTVEHYFQAQKFPGSDHARAIREARSPALAKRLGQSRKVKLRRDWESVKVDVMRRAVRAKFRAHPELAELLLSTGDRPIVEAAPNDYVWGAGSKGTGKNWLGRILVEVREELAAELAAGTEG